MLVESAAFGCDEPGCSALTGWCADFEEAEQVAVAGGWEEKVDSLGVRHFCPAHATAAVDLAGRGWDDSPMFMRFAAGRVPPLDAPEVLSDETMGSVSWQKRWEAVLVEAVSEHDPWGLVGMRPDGDYHLFDADGSGIWRAATYPSSRVWFLFPEWPT